MEVMVCAVSSGGERFTAVHEHFRVSVDESATLVLSFQGHPGSDAAVAGIEVNFILLLKS